MFLNITERRAVCRLNLGFDFTCWHLVLFNHNFDNVLERKASVL